MINTLAAAQQYSAAGLNTIPVRVDGSKSPDVAWKKYQEESSTPDEHQRWFGNGTAHGIGIVHGRISGNSETIDFDSPDLCQPFLTRCSDAGYSDLCDRLVHIGTPTGGDHLLYRCEEPVSGNQKLAERLEDVPESTDGARLVAGRWVKIKTLIETRGEGGYTLAPGSPDACHPVNQPYRFLKGRPATIPTITAEERAVLLAIASTFNEHVDEASIVDAPRKERTTAIKDSLRPGDDYNLRNDYETALEQSGWRRMGSGDKVIWQRPGKSGRGISATSNYSGSNLFYVFSSNASPFSPQKAYTPFAVYALLEHGGNYTEAAKDLAAQGFGEQKATAGPQSKKEATASDTTATIEWELPVPFTGHNLPAFPVEALPRSLAEMVTEVAISVQVAPEMPAMLALAVVAAASARRCLIQVGRTHSEPLNLFVAVTGLPGERKSAVMEALAQPMRSMEQVLSEEGSKAQATAQEARTVEEARLQQLRAEAAKEKDAEERARLIAALGEEAGALTVVPPLPRLLADDTTPEKLGAMMAEQGGTMAILSAEGGLLDIIAGRYSDGKANMDLILKGHSGESVLIDRKGSSSLHIARARLTLGLAVQPDVLSSLTDTPAFRGRGLLGRFLYSLPQSKVGSRLYQDRPISAAARASYNATILSILSLPQADPEDPSNLHILRLQGEALNTWAEHANGVERRQFPGADLSSIPDWSSKLAGAVARIAGGFHLVENSQDKAPWNIPVSVETVLAAWAVGEYLIPHAQAAFGLMGADPAIALAQRLLAWIEREKQAEFSLRDCHRANRSVGSPKALEPGLTLLCERGFLRLKKVPARSGPGQPASPIYEVNPEVNLLGQNGQNTQK